MSQLIKWQVCGHEAWQWGDGPVFVESENMENPREWAVMYGETVARLEALKELAGLSRLKVINDRKKHEST